MSHHRQRPDLYYDFTRSLCETCHRLVDAKVLFRDGQVFLEKRCPEHGRQRVLINEDEEYYRRAREVFTKPSEMPLRFDTKSEHGCPFDCGLCEDHEQHSCLTVIELTDHCNLSCPICYAGSGPQREEYRSLENVIAMFDATVRNEGEPDVVQLSGGEPTLHPDFFAILDAAKERPIRHLMVNTNGVRIATDEAFAERLAGYMPGIEIYLQFDSLEEAPLRALRGADLREVRARALDRLDALGVSTTLVVTVKKGLNDGELGRIVDFALERPSVRGVTFQPVQEAGRLEDYDPARDRLTLGGVRRRILEQSDAFKPEDIVPVPCHPDAIAMGYALKQGGKVTPLTGMVPPEVLLAGDRSTIAFERDEDMKERLFDCLSAGHSPSSGAGSLQSLLCCLPSFITKKKIGYDNLFRIIIMEFLDAASFDVRSVKKSCVHIIHPETLRPIPFDTYNLFYRPGLEKVRDAAMARSGLKPAPACSRGPAEVAER